MNPCPPLQNLYQKPKTSICLNMRIFFSGEPTSHKSILSQNPWGRAQKLLMPLTELEILQPWLMTPKIQFAHLNQHTHTHAHKDFHKSLQPWWSSKISLLILINIKGFQKFLQPMMKLKNQVAHINQQSFTHPTTNTLKLKNLSSLICWINTKLFLQNWK